MLAKSGEVVVIHDETLERTTNGQGKVGDYVWADLRKLDAGSWFHPDFNQEKILVLSEVLDFLEQEQLAANIEIKTVFGQEKIAARKVIDALDCVKHKEILISSFSRLILKEVRHLSSSCRLGFLMDVWQDDWHSFCESYNCVTVNANHAILDELRIQEIKKTNRVLTAYVVNEPARAKQLFSWGVDAIFSDCPKVMLNLF